MVVEGNPIQLISLTKEKVQDRSHLAFLISKLRLLFSHERVFDIVKVERSQNRVSHTQLVAHHCRGKRLVDHPSLLRRSASPAPSNTGASPAPSSTADVQSILAGQMCCWWVWSQLAASLLCRGCEFNPSFPSWCGW
jgi:hypothetical protein